MSLSLRRYRYCDNGPRGTVKKKRPTALPRSAFWGGDSLRGPGKSRALHAPKRSLVFSNVEQLEVNVNVLPRLTFHAIVPLMPRQSGKRPTTFNVSVLAITSGILKDNIDVIAGAPPPDTRSASLPMHGHHHRHLLHPLSSTSSSSSSQ